MKLACALLCVAFAATLVLADDDSINIHVVAHSHDDTGWLRTVDQYYEYEVAYIYDTVTNCLLENPDRKYIVVEIAFFTRWWHDQTATRQDEFKGLVENGQIEFIIGGWCMNDEAATYYEHIITQMTEGHVFLLDTFGAKPKYGWQIDPFGASAAQATLESMMGFEGHVINRIDYRQKDKMFTEKTLQFHWRASSSLKEKTEIFTHILDHHYCTPDGFDWEHGVSQVLPRDDGPEPVIDHKPSWITPENVKSIAERFIAVSRERADLYRTKNVLIPYGCDFNFQNAEMKFKNMDKLIRYINENAAELGATAHYSTVSDFFTNVETDATKLNVTFPTVTEDFFPYADNDQSYWTGYFTSRPELKRLVRAAAATQRQGEQLHAMHASQLSADMLAASFTDLQVGRDAISVSQHHDAVTGTERDFVAYDYQLRLAKGAEAVSKVGAAALHAKVNGDGPAEVIFTGTLNPFSEAPVPVIVHNSLGWAREQIVSVVAESQSLVAKDTDGNVVPQQITGDRLYFHATVPAMGVATYFLAVDEKSAGPVTADKHNGAFALENEYVKADFSAKGELQKVTSKSSSLEFEITHELAQYTPATASQNSGAYIFRPKAGAAAEVVKMVDFSYQTGPVMDVVTQTFHQTAGKLEHATITQTIRVYKGLPEAWGSHLDISMEIAPLEVDFSRMDGRELVTRFSTNLGTGDQFYTDSNGMDVQTRTRNLAGRPGDADAGVALAGNYYPVVTMAYVRDEQADSTPRQFTMLTNSAHGGSSLAEGQLELMVARRLLKDDSRGVGFALDDTNTTHTSFFAVFDDLPRSAMLHRRAQLALEYPLTVAAASNSGANSIEEYKAGKTTSFSAIVSDLPDNVHVLTYAVRDKSDTIVLRLQHIFELGEHPTLSKPATVDLAALFADPIASLEERTLTLNTPVTTGDLSASFQAGIQAGAQAGVMSAAKKVTLAPMEIRTFLIKMGSSTV